MTGKSVWIQVGEFRLLKCFWKWIDQSRYNVAPAPPSVKPRPMSPSLTLSSASLHPASTSADLRSVFPPSSWYSLSCSRYSLSGGIKTVPVPYLPADTTRSVSSTSEYGDRAGGRVSVRPHSRTSRSSKQRGSPTTSGSTSGIVFLLKWPCCHYLHLWGMSNSCNVSTQWLWQQWLCPSFLIDKCCHLPVIQPKQFCLNILLCQLFFKFWDFVPFPGYSSSRHLVAK